jgi:methylated-DNA-[protein]-cysteine S-methyltransferase
MDETLTYHICETELGYVALVFSQHGLRATTLPTKTQEEAFRQAADLGATEPAAERDLADIPERVAAIVAGKHPSLAFHIDWDGLTPFRRAVMEETMRIPAGQTLTYAEVAARVGKPAAARAVGRVMATNPLPLVVPCHRVVGSDGTLHGFGGGLWMKEALLKAEGVDVAGA